MEVNWRDDTRWSRSYWRLENGNHRAERALLDQVPWIWAQITEYRFAPPGDRPPDRQDVLGPPRG